MSTFDVAGALAAGYSMADVANEMAQHASFDVGGARNAGYSDSEIIDHLQPNTLPQELQGGAHDTMTGLAQTANVIGGVANRNGYTGIGGAATTAGKFIADHTPDAVPEKPDADVGATLKNPNASWSDVGHAVLHSAVRAAPGTVPLLAAAAVPGVGPLLAGAAAGAESLGPTAYQRAANSGRSEPTTEDVEGAIPSTVVQAGLGAVLPGGAASKIANPLLRGAAKVGLEAGAGMGMDAANQLGGSIGTNAGAHLDPAEMAGVGLTQGAIGAGRQVLPVVRAGVKAGTDDVMSRLGDQPVSVEDAASQKRVGDAYDTHLQAVQDTRGGNPQPTAVLNSLKTETFQRTKAYGRELLDSGILPEGFGPTLSAVLDQAQRHNNEIASGGLDTSSLFDDLKNAKVDPSALQPLLNGIRDLNTLSTQSFLKNQTGPFRQLGNGLAQVGAVGGALATGNIPLAVGTVLGHNQVGKMGGLVGGALDNILGTATPKILLQRMAAERYLKANGADAGPATLPSLRDATAAIPPAPDTSPTVDALAQAKVDRLVKANAVNIAAADKLPTYTVHQDSVAGTAAMVQALQSAARTQAIAGSAPAALKDRMAVGNPVGDLTQNIGSPSAFPTRTPRPSNGPLAPVDNTAAVAQPTLPQPPTAPPQAPPMAPGGSPVAAQGISGPAPALNPETLAIHGRPWEKYVGKTVPGATRQQVYDAVDAVHTPETAAQLKGNMSGADAEHLQPVIEHLAASQPGANGTQEIAMPKQWEAGKAAYQSDVSRQAAEARSVGLPDTAAALAAVGITKGQVAKAQVRDAHLASITDGAKRAQAARMFTKRLMHHGPK